MKNSVKWVLDPTHSEITFKVKHLMITNVTGVFEKFQAEFNSSKNDLSDAKINAIMDPSSVFTKVTDRDNHLKSADFFDVDNHKEIKFESTSFIRNDDSNYRLKGLLSIKGVKNEVAFDVEFGGLSKDPWGNQKAGFSLSGKINRKDWGLEYNAALETGGVLIGDEIKISAEVQFLKQVAVAEEASVAN